MDGKIDVILSNKKQVALDEQVAIAIEAAAAATAQAPVLAPVPRGGLFGDFAQGWVS